MLELDVVAVYTPVDHSDLVGHVGLSILDRLIWIWIWLIRIIRLIRIVRIVIETELAELGYVDVVDVVTYDWSELPSCRLSYVWVDISDVVHLASLEGHNTILLILTSSVCRLVLKLSLSFILVELALGRTPVDRTISIVSLSLLTSCPEVVSRSKSTRYEDVGCVTLLVEATAIVWVRRLRDES